MLSYMSIDRVEGDFIVCEVENIPTIEAKVDEFWSKPCFMTDVPKAMFSNKGLPIQQGQIYKVIHNGETVDEICAVDENERRRRVQILSNLF